ncbi:MAG: recombinase family protein [Bdellovibrionales bacterium]
MNSRLRASCFSSWFKGFRFSPFSGDSPVEKFGGGAQWTNEPNHHHDFIELSPRTQSRIYEKCAPLYEKGLSIRDIEERTGIPKSTVREALTKSGVSLRNPLNGNARHIDRLHTKRGGHTPYGYAYLDGQLLIDPKEQIIVRKILKLHQSGMSGNAIATELNCQKIPSRTGKTWRPCVVRRIIKANQTKKTKK